MCVHAWFTSGMKSLLYSGIHAFIQNIIECMMKVWFDPKSSQVVNNQLFSIASAMEYNMPKRLCLTVCLWENQAKVEHGGRLILPIFGIWAPFGTQLSE